MRLKDTPVLIIDCQTTGASPQYGQILELGWTLYHPDQKDAEPLITSRLVQLPPDEVLPERIKRITGITDSDMLTALSPQSVISELVETVSVLGSPAIAVAHYAQFEQSFINHFFETHASLPLPFIFVCTCQIAKRLFPDLPSRAIRALGGYLGLTIDEEKRASGHVHATTYIWRELIPRLEAQGIASTSDLSEFLARPLPKRVPGQAAYELPLEKLKRLEMPDMPGVYKMLSRSGKILYVGKATSLKSRVNSYFRGRKGKDSKTKELISQIHDIETIQVESPLEAALLETDLIKKFNPPYNRALRERGRDLVFYDRDFGLVAREQSETCPVGPFVSEQAMMPLLALCESFNSGTYDEALFWNLAPLEVIEEGASLFIDDYLGQSPVQSEETARQAILDGELTLVADVTVRDLLALGMRLYRAELNAALAYERENLDTDEEAAIDCNLTLFDEDEGSQMRALVSGTDAEAEEADEDEDDEDDEDDEEQEIDAFEIEDMIVGILVRSAKLYLQCRNMTRILNCRVLFKEGKLPMRTLVFTGGVIVEARESVPDDLPEPLKDELAPLLTGVKGKSKNKNFALIIPAHYQPLGWSTLNLDTYDRLRVLLTELGRLISKGRLLPLRNLVYKDLVQTKSQDLCRS